MGLRLFSHINGDGDLIEAWLHYYLRLGVECFHLIVHGTPVENERLLAIKDRYPITIEDSYQGPFPAPISGQKSHITEKKKRLDALLARHTGEWILLVDSDEFVEFPYRDIQETIRYLESADANLMAAPMLQRLRSDGSLDSPPVIEDPFQIFPLCSMDLYRRMGVKAEIFKFPLFYCQRGTELVEEGNHYPPRGPEARATGIVGVTHHFKFRPILSQRLERRIDSPHLWRNDSVMLQEYLESHSNHLPLEGSFLYSREELFKRRLLRQLPTTGRACECQQSSTQPLVESQKGKVTALGTQTKVIPPGNGKLGPLRPPAGPRIMFVLPKTTEFSGVERHLLDLLERLPEPLRPALIVCLGPDMITARMNREQQAQVVMKCLNKPQSLWDWLRILREHKPDIAVFHYSCVDAFPWQASFAAMLAGVHRRISIQHRIPPPLPPPLLGTSPRDMIRRLIGGRAREVLKAKISARISAFFCSTTVCVSNAVRDRLVSIYGIPPRKTVVVSNGVSSSTFIPSQTTGAAVRARLDIGPEDFVLVCAARLVETKGLDILIRAVSKVLRQGVSCKCIILGAGPLKQRLQQKVNSEGVWDHVFFEGFQQDVRPYLQAGSAFVLTSYLEGLPISVLEAMACGLPCIVTNVGGSPEAVEDQVSGLVIPPGSVEAATDAILYLATNPNRRREMARKTRETVRKSFDIDVRMRELVDVLLGSPSGPTARCSSLTASG
jgi:glycosyltransferase involved in cell wall biosynthesis